MPDNRQEQIVTPGAGDHIASAVVCFAFGQPGVLFDTHTKKIACRVWGGPTRPTWRLRLDLHHLAGPTGANPILSGIKRGWTSEG